MRIVTALPGMLGQIVTEILREQPDMELVDEVPDAALSQAVDRTGAQFVLVGVDDGCEAERLRPMLDRHPRLKVLAVEDDGRRGFLYELRPRRRPLGEMSPPRLVEALREAALDGGAA